MATPPTVNPAVAEAPRMSIMLKRRVETKTLEAMRAQYPDIKIECRLNSGVHHHPRLALEREMALRSFATRMANDTMITAANPIYDVFGNESAMRRLGLEHCHSVMPAQVASDEVRWSAADPERACRHLPDECRCKVPSVALYVQSVQYAGPQALAAMVSRCTTHRAYSIVHRFRGLAGSFYGDEQVWHRVEGGKVHCTMDGGAVSWQHNACDWLDEEVWIPALGCTLVSNMFFQEGKTLMYEHQLVHRVPPPRAPVLPWDPALAKESAGLYALPSSFAGSAEKTLNLTSVRFKKARIRLVAGILIFLDGMEEEIVLSADIVCTLSQLSLGRVRNRELYVTMLRQARSLYADVPNLPATRVMGAVLFSVMLALNQSTAEEIDVLMRVQHDQSGLWAAHSDAVMFNPRTSVSGSTLAACAASSTVSAAATYMSPGIWGVTVGGGATGSTMVACHVPAVMAMVVTTPIATFTVAPLMFAFSACSAVATGAWYLNERWKISHHERVLTTDWESAEQGSHDRSYVLCAEFAYAAKFPPVDRKKLKRNVEPRDGASVTTFPVLPKAPEAGMSHEGICISGLRPTHYASDQDSMLSAVTNRITKPVSMCRPGALRTAKALFERTVDYMTYVRATSAREIRVGPEDVEAWAAARYNRARTMDLVFKFCEMEGVAFRLAPKDRRVKAFVKREKQLALELTKEGEVAGFADKAPRPILQHSDATLVLACPVLTELSQRWKTVWAAAREEGRVPGILFSGGLSGEAIGAWVGDVEEVLGESLVDLDSDGSAWDAHMGEEAMAMAASLAVGKTRIWPTRAKQILMDTPKLVGASALGVKFKAGKQMATGAPWTSTYNGWINATVAVWCLESACGTKPVAEDSTPALGRDYFMMIAGDDLRVLVRRAFWSERMGDMDARARKAAWEAECDKLGFEITINERAKGQGEWCSRWFYPTRVGERVVPLPGAKIGRLLTRAGWFLDVKDGSNLRSALLGQLEDNHHVPFVREYLKKSLDLLDPRCGRRPKDAPHSFHMGRRHDYGDETWEWLAAKYGLTKEDLAVFESKLELVTKLPAVVEWDVGRLLAVE